MIRMVKALPTLVFFVRRRHPPDLPPSVVANNKVSGIILMTKRWTTKGSKESETSSRFESRLKQCGNSR